MVPVPGRIEIRAYDERWPAEFETIARDLRAGLGDLALRVDHIGSTSVPGLAAKDVIDVQVSVADLHDPRLVVALDGLGTGASRPRRDHVPPGDRRDPAEWEKRYLRPPASWRATHVHVREEGRANTRYALLFRDHLRHSPAAAAAYAEVKRALARLHPDDVDAYYAVKDPACDLVMDAAERWARETGWTLGSGRQRPD